MRQWLFLSPRSYSAAFPSSRARLREHLEPLPVTGALLGAEDREAAAAQEVIGGLLAAR